MNDYSRPATDVAQSRRDFLRRTACSSLACATSGALFGQLSHDEFAARCVPELSAGRRLQGARVPVPGRRQRLVQPADPDRHGALQHLQHVAQRSGSGRDGDRQGHADPVHPATLDQAGDTYGMHPSCPELAALFESGKLAFVVNAGTALQPTAKANYQTPGYPLPPQLFSHADQQGQWQFGQPAQNGTGRLGRPGGRRLSVLNPGMTIPMSISLNGQNRLQAGQLVQPYSVTASGPPASAATTESIGTAKMNALEELLAQTYPDPLSRRYKSTLQNSIDWYHTLNAALENATDVSANFPAKGVNPVADAMQEIARIISVRAHSARNARSSSSRTAAFDTHDGQLDANSGQPKLFATIRRHSAACTLRQISSACRTR
jgi:uncharacterized protein (DUF1501 family)